MFVAKQKSVHYKLELSTGEVVCMKKKHHRLFAGILVGLISIAMIGSGFIMYFGGGGIPPAGSTSSTNTVNSEAAYQAQKTRIAAIAKQAEADPNNLPLLKDLGNEYYNAGVDAQTAAPSEVQENFKNAVEAYQKVLKTDKDPNVMVDMATAAFRGGDNNLAEATFKEVLATNPGFYNALVSYGIFLAEAKQDLPGAIAQWQKAEGAAPNSSDKKQIQDLITQAQSQLKASANGASSPNPAPKNETSKPGSSGK